MNIEPENNVLIMTEDNNIEITPATDNVNVVSENQTLIIEESTNAEFTSNQNILSLIFNQRGAKGDAGLTVTVNNIEQEDGNITLTTDDIPETEDNMYIPTLPVEEPNKKFLNGNKEWKEINIPTGDFLKLDQTIPQTVDKGMPNFKGGLKVPGNILNFFINLSPVVYNTTNYYISGDAGVVFYFSPTQDVQVVTDDGFEKSPILIAGMSVTQPTIYMYLINAFGGAAQFTCYSDLNEADFLEFIRALAEDPAAVIDYHETAFTYADGVYTNVTTKSVCPPSENTTWTNPSVITTEYGGFTVNPTTSNIDHVGNYTNNVTTSIMKTKGQFKAGNGNLIDLVTCPITSNPILDLSGGGYLQFAMTFVPEIISSGTVDTPISRSVYASGVYGTTMFEGGYATYSGTALGMWSALQNTVSGLTTLQEGVGMRAGMTYASDSNSEMYVRDMICFQTDFTNLNNGTSKHDNIKHYEAKLLSNNVNSCTNNYGVYIADNSLRATNSWGLYSLEPSNYAKKMYLGATPTKPTEDLEVQGNIKAGGYKSSDGTSGLTATKVFNDGAVVNTVTIKNGLITDWTQV